MDTRELRSLRGQVNILKKIARDNLGQGIWGLEKDSEKFTHEEIIFLFARVFPVFGIDYIKEIRTEYPDCICVKERAEIGIEFEPLLSSFKDHLRKDDLTRCQYVVCWKNDLALHDPMSEEIEKFNIDVIELGKLYEKIKTKRPKRAEVITQKMIDGLTEYQIKILKAFVDADRDQLTRDEIGAAIRLHGKPLGGPLSGFKPIVTLSDDWLVRKRPDRTWEFNRKHKEKVVATIKKFKI